MYLIGPDFSWRYGVIGIYKDRNSKTWRLYLPFVRVSIVFKEA